jgi:hypothetical protein
MFAAMHQYIFALQHETAGRPHQETEGIVVAVQDNPAAARIHEKSIADIFRKD